MIRKWAIGPLQLRTHIGYFSSHLRRYVFQFSVKKNKHVFRACAIFLSLPSMPSDTFPSQPAYLQQHTPSAASLLYSMFIKFVKETSYLTQNCSNVYNFLLLDSEHVLNIYRFACSVLLRVRICSKS